MEIVIFVVIAAVFYLVGCLSNEFASFLTNSLFFPIVIFVRFGVVLYYIRKYSHKK